MSPGLAFPKKAVDLSTYAHTTPSKVTSRVENDGVCRQL